MLRAKIVFPEEGSVRDAERALRLTFVKIERETEDCVFLNVIQKGYTSYEISAERRETLALIEKHLRFDYGERVLFRVDPSSLSQVV